MSYENLKQKEFWISKDQRRERSFMLYTEGQLRKVDSVKGRKAKKAPSAPLEPRASWPAELPDTRKGPHRIPHGILRPLVSGTQRRPQSNCADLRLQYIGKQTARA